MRLRRDQNDRLAANEPLRGEVRYGLSVELVVLVELDDMAILARLGQQVFPRRVGLRVHRTRIPATTGA